MRMNWERLGAAGIGILVIAGLFFVAIHWDPTGLVSETESSFGKVMGVILSVVVFIMGGFLILLLLSFVGVGIYNLFCWVFEDTASTPEPALEPEPAPEPALPEPEPLELDEIIPRSALMDFS